MSLGNRSLGGCSLGGRRPSYMYNGDESGLTTIEYTVPVTEHLNIKYRKIITYLWSRQPRVLEYEYLVDENGNYIVDENGNRIDVRVHSAIYSKISRQSTNWTEQLKQSSTWTKIDKQS